MKHPAKIFCGISPGFPVDEECRALLDNWYYFHVGPCRDLWYMANDGGHCLRAIADVHVKPTFHPLELRPDAYGDSAAKVLTEHVSRLGIDVFHFLAVAGHADIFLRFIARANQKKSHVYTLTTRDGKRVLVHTPIHAFTKWKTTPKSG